MAATIAEFIKHHKPHFNWAALIDAVEGCKQHLVRGLSTMTIILSTVA